MRARRLFAAWLTACGIALGASARAEEAPATPVQLADKLQRAQQHIAEGDPVAYAAMPKLLREISVELAAAKPEAWRNPRNVSAAAIYLLSGGQPSVVTHLIESGAIAKDDNLTKGALAYVLGHEAEARKLLGPIDPQTLDLALGGQVAFVQSVLLTAADPKRAVQLLDLARLLAPGGLVEEAALRREAILVGEKPEGAEKFMALANQYMSRFPRSPYGVDFLKSFTASLVRLRLAEESANLPKIERMTAGLASDDRRDLLLAISRAALVDGKLAAADAIVAKALRLAAPGSPEEARAMLYQAAAKTVTSDYEAGVAELGGVDQKKLPRRDAALLAAARAIARQIREPTVSTLTSAPDQIDDSAAATIRLAEAALLNAANDKKAESP